MKKIASKITNSPFNVLTVCCALLLGVVFYLPGCGGTGKVNLDTTNGNSVAGGVSYGNSNIQVGATGSYDVQTGDWTGGLVLTFTKAPDAATVMALQSAGAVPVKADSVYVYVIKNYSDASVACRATLISALAHGAVVTGQ